MSEWWPSRIEKLDGGEGAKQRRGDTEVTSLSEVFLHKRRLSKVRANARNCPLRALALWVEKTIMKGIPHSCVSDRVHGVVKDSDVRDFGYAVIARELLVARCFGKTEGFTKRRSL